MSAQYCTECNRKLHHKNGEKNRNITGLCKICLDNSQTYNPTAEEIAEACIKIRAERPERYARSPMEVDGVNLTHKRTSGIKVCRVSNWSE